MGVLDLVRCGWWLFWWVPLSFCETLSYVRSSNKLIDRSEFSWASPRGHITPCYDDDNRISTALVTDAKCPSPVNTLLVLLGLILQTAFAQDLSMLVLSGYIEESSHWTALPCQKWRYKELTTWRREKPRSSTWRGERPRHYSISKKYQEMGIWTSIWGLRYVWDQKLSWVAQWQGAKMRLKSFVISTCWTYTCRWSMREIRDQATSDYIEIDYTIMGYARRSL